MLEKGAKDTLFSGKYYHILKRKNNYLLFYRPDPRKKKYKVILRECKVDDRSYRRLEAYAELKDQEIYSLRDSVLAPGMELYSSLRRTFIYSDQNLPDSLLRKQIDSVSDSLKHEIIHVHKPKVELYTKVGDSIATTDTATIFRLLANAGYDRGNRYSQLFLEKLAYSKPEYLIQYIDQNPINKKEVLNTIAGHRLNKQIVRRVKEIDVITPGKKEIVKQRGKRVRQNIVAGGTALFLVAFEVGLIVGLITWIF